MDEPVVIAEYRSDWPALFAKEERVLKEALGSFAVGIEHFGSTSIPGLAAKPVIDILVLVEELHEEEFYAQKLRALGYALQRWPDQPPQHLFFTKGEPRTHNLHIVINNGYEHRRHIAFRDYLRRFPLVAEEYETLKRVLSQVYANDRNAYTQAKTAFVRAVEARVLGMH